MNPTLFLSPAKPGSLIWGVGPTMTIPTGTDSTISSYQFSMGPSAVALMMPGHWVFGALANNQWSLRDNDSHPYFNQLLVQYFVNYNLEDGWYLSSAPIITANWSAENAGDVWTVPFGGGIGKIVRLGPLPINIQVQSFYNSAKPDEGADWQLRAQIQLLFPK